MNPEDHLYGEETTIESEMLKDIDDLLDLGKTNISFQPQYLDLYDV